MKVTGENIVILAVARKIIHDMIKMAGKGKT
jgi:hypothetical protein